MGLRDPEGLAADPVLVPRALLPILALLDGRHTVDDILVELGAPEDPALRERVLAAVRTLDEKLFLEGARLERARQEAARAYRAAPLRRAIHAGLAYDARPQALRAQLESFDSAPGGPAQAPPPDASRPLKGLIAPHIDYKRGGACYAWAYRELAARQGADLYVILGTCHAGLRSPFAATLKSYDTPLGPAATDQALVKRLAERSGLDLLAEEPAHRTEHSIELQAVYLRHVTPEKRPFKVVPILASYCHELMARGRAPKDDDAVRRFVDALREELAVPGRAACVIAGADLAHMGTRFGDARLTEDQLKAAQRDDLAALALAEDVEPEAFFDAVAKDGDRRRLCGFSPIHALLCALRGEARGKLLRYAQWPDPDETVTFASLAFT